MRYYIFSLGCQQNTADALILSKELDRLGFLEAEETRADIIFVFACAVRQSAVNRIISRLNRWKKKRVVLTACVLPYDINKLKPYVSAIYPTNELLQNIETILHVLNYQTLNKNAVSQKSEKHEYITIQYGCDNFCAYCAVPYTRGPEVSKPINQIIQEIKDKILHGASEFTILGQNVNSYNLSQKQKLLNRIAIKGGKVSDYNSPFARLLARIEKIQGINRLSFLSPNPQDMTRDVINWMEKSTIFSHELNFPVQSGSNRILKSMRRYYTASQYLAQVKSIRRAVPDIWLSTDIIVGFPGETNSDFNATRELCQKAKFNKAYIAKYSPRRGTYAQKYLKDNIPMSEKRRRFHILDQMINHK